MPRSKTRQNRKMVYDDIAIYHDPDEIDTNRITICLDLKLLSDDHVDHDLVKLWNTLEIKPTLIIFDLDLTLWPFWIDTHVSPPFRKHINECDDHTILDQDNKKLTFYADVPKILNTLRNYCLKQDGHMAVASRTSESIGALELMELFGWKNHFNSFQMYPGTKVRHINKICNELGVHDKRSILFFDDDKRNMVDTLHLGITGYLLDRKYGLTQEDCAKGLKMHETKLKK